MLRKTPLSKLIVQPTSVYIQPHPDKTVVPSNGYTVYIYPPHPVKSQIPAEVQEATSLVDFTKQHRMVSIYPWEQVCFQTSLL